MCVPCSKVTFARCLRSVSRVLREGGRVVFDTYIVDAARQTVQTQKFEYGGSYCKYTREEVEELANESRLAVESIAIGWHINGSELYSSEDVHVVQLQKVDRSAS